MSRRLSVVVASACGLLVLIAAISIAQYLLVILVLALLGLLASATSALWRGDSLHEAVRIYAIFAGLAGIYLTCVRLMSLVGPIASVLLVGAAGAALGVVSYRRGVQRHWIQTGRCGNCGFDLRQSVLRCPECGQPIPEELARRRRIAASIRSAMEHPAQLEPPTPPQDSEATPQLPPVLIDYTPPPPPDLSPIPLEPEPQPDSGPSDAGTAPAPKPDNASG